MRLTRGDHGRGAGTASWRKGRLPHGEGGSEGAGRPAAGGGGRRGRVLELGGACEGRLDGFGWRGCWCCGTVGGRGGGGAEWRGGGFGAFEGGGAGGAVGKGGGFVGRWEGLGGMVLAGLASGGRREVPWQSRCEG